MKLRLLILLILNTRIVFGSELDTIKLNSQIKDVTVFFDGAQVTREVKLTINKGKYLFLLENLPAEINPQSIQIDNNQKGEIISVKHELVYPNEKSKTIIEYEEKIKLLEIKLKEISNEIAVYDLEEGIILDNSILNKKENGTSISEISEASNFYRSKLNEIKKNKLKLAIDFEKVKEEIHNLYLELNKKVSNEKKTYSKISFTFSSESQINAKIKISYFVTSAGWRPLYDFRVNDINEPLNLLYNANIFQSTGEDWKNINLKLSTNRPSLSNLKPELDVWNVERRNIYQKENIIDGLSELQGHVSDEATGEPLPFVNIEITKNGEVITGGTTDFDGRYYIKPIKSGYYDVKVRFIGYKSVEMKRVILNANKITFQDFKLQPNTLELSQFEVVEYKVPLTTNVRGARAQNTKEDILSMPGRSSNVFANSIGGIGESKSKNEIYFVDGYESNSNITSLEYKIDIPYTIPSDGKNYNVKIKEVKVPVTYKFVCVPKIEKDAFLIAEISDWTRLNLLSGTTSIYYNGVFTGQSEIDIKSTKDTLSISLNRDKNIIVERTLLKEKNEKQFVGNNIKETINWNITVKNNKAVSSKIIIEDQFPISENNSITIEKLDYSNGLIDDKTGKVTWEIDLAPNEKKELILKYSVKYPNSMKLFIE